MDKDWEEYFTFREDAEYTANEDYPRDGTNWKPIDDGRHLYDHGGS